MQKMHIAIFPCFIRNISYSKKVHIQNSLKKLNTYSQKSKIIYICPFFNHRLVSNNKRFRGLNKKINYFNFFFSGKKKLINSNLHIIFFSILPDYFDVDGIHLNENGHEFLKKIIIKKMID